MNLTTRAIDANGMIDAQRRLLLEGPLPIADPTCVRVIMLLPDETDIDEG